MQRALRWSAFLLITVMPVTGHAFTTRFHIALSNEVRQSLVESGDGTIQLRWSSHAVQIPQGDADAIVAEPLAFRAGSIGPDMMIFPGLTDASHAVHQDPYRQCELLYEEAFTDAEKAFALGCFLHGSTDAIAHHFVNYFTGETFTLTPLEGGRAVSSYGNVVGHIASESIIQSSFRQADTSRFVEGQMEHDLPVDFILRNYFDPSSPLWMTMGAHSMEKWQAVQAAEPEGNVQTWAANAGFGPWEQLVMAPVYVDEIQRLRGELRAFLDDEIADMANPSSTRGAQLGVSAGLDGVIGTPDDDTACATTCPALAGRYYVFVNVLAPRFSAGGQELPSAFDALSESLGTQLYGFLPALVQVIRNLSTFLNSGLDPSDLGDHGFDVDASVIDTTFQPLTDWLDQLVRTTDQGFDDLADTVTPGWYQDLSNFFASLGVDVTIGSLLRVVFGSVIDQVRDALEDRVRDAAETYLGELSREYRDNFGTTSADIEARLDATAPSTLTGHALTRPYESGMFAYAINITAAVLANHEVVLVDSGPIENGPSSFDASYTMDWTQLGLCPYLRDAVFPRGTTLSALLSVQEADGTFHESVLSEAPPIECHDGDAFAFGTPSQTSCGYTELGDFVSSPTGSLSRAFPPEHAEGSPGCRRLIVPGLPDPPPIVDEDAGVPPGVDAGPRPDSSVPPGVDGGVTPPGPTGGDCGCSAPGGAPGAPLSLSLLFALGLLFSRRRRRAGAALESRAPLALGVLALFALGCDPAPPAVDAGPPLEDAGPIVEEDSGAPPDMDAGPRDAGPDPFDAGVDSGFDGDAGPDRRAEVLAALTSTNWQALQSRVEGTVERTRAFEMRFASDARWLEIRNPYGPARQRVLRSMILSRDGRTIRTTVNIPNGWETPESLRNRRETFTFQIVEGTPRFLRITSMTTGISEDFVEGDFPAPTEGLTGEVRVFGSTGSVYEAYCGANATNWERAPLWDFARGESGTTPIAEDVVAGVQLGSWQDGVGPHAIVDIDGFDALGGTELPHADNYTLRLSGSLAHDAHISFREEDDRYDHTAAWILVDDQVGGGPGSEIFEVFHFTGNDDETVTLPGLPGAGSVDVEVLVVRCAGAGDEPFYLQASFGTASGPFDGIGVDNATPVVDTDLFPVSF